jgi:uncharacterized protein YukE
MTRITALTDSALSTRWLVAVLWLLIALTLSCAVRAAEPAGGDSLHRSAAVAQEHAEHFGNRMQASAHKVIDATARSLHRAFDATARGTHRAAEAITHAADRAKSAFHNI